MAKKVQVEVVPSLAKDAGRKIGGALSAAIGSAAHGGGAGGFANMAGAAGAAAGIPGAQAIGPIFDTIGAFVQKANPAIMEQMAQAFEDMQGVIGQALMPIMQALLPVFRGVADAVATLLPSAETMSGLFKAFQPLFQVAQERFKALADVFAPIIEAGVQLIGQVMEPLIKVFVTYDKIVTALIKAMEPLVQVAAQLAPLLMGPIVAGLELFAKFVELIANEFVSAITTATKALYSFINYIVETFPKVAKALGLKAIKPGSSQKSSFGAAHKGAQYQGIEALGANLAQAGFGGPTSPEVRTAEAVEQSNNLLSQMLQAMRAGLNPNPGFAGNS